jgi:hypothetical protein
LGALLFAPENFEFDFPNVAILTPHPREALQRCSGYQRLYRSSIVRTIGVKGPNRPDQRSICLCQQCYDEVREVEIDSFRFPWDKNEQAQHTPEEFSSLAFHRKDLQGSQKRRLTPKTSPPNFQDAQTLRIYCRIRRLGNRATTHLFEHRVALVRLSSVPRSGQLRVRLE